METEVVEYKESLDMISDLRSIIDQAQKIVHSTVNVVLIQRNWLIGKRIAEEELKGKERADYGASIMGNVSKTLTEIYGRGFTKSNIYNFYQFYKTYPNIFQSVIGKSETLLTWTHYLVLLQVYDEKARAWYEKEAFDQTWSVRTLQRNVSSQYYYRLLSSQNKEPVEAEMKTLTANFQNNKLDFIKQALFAYRRRIEKRNRSSKIIF